MIPVECKRKIHHIPITSIDPCLSGSYCPRDPGDSWGLYLEYGGRGEGSLLRIKQGEGRRPL